MSEYIFTMGNFHIRWYSVLILVGVVVGIIVLLREGDRFNFQKDFLFNMAFWSIIIGLIGARLYYVLFNFNMYAKDPISILKIWEGGLAIHGGLIAGLITMLIYSYKYKADVLRMTDFAVPGVILAQAIGRWGNFFNGEAHGAATTLAHLQNLHLPQFIIDGMYINGNYYEPTFLYESILCLIGFIILYIIRRMKYIKIGSVTGVYLVYYGVVRFVIESMRTDSLTLGGFKMAQIVSIIMFIAGIIILLKNVKKGRFESLYNDECNFVQF